MAAAPHLPRDKTSFVASVEQLPLGAASFYALAERFSSRPDFALLDAKTGGRDAGRYSFFSFWPFARLTTKRDVSILRIGADEYTSRANPFSILQDLLKRYSVHPMPVRPPVPFLGGAIGYFAYELGRHLEVLPQAAVDDLDLPDGYLCFYNFAIALRHADNTVFLCHLASRGAPVGVPKDVVRAEVLMAPHAVDERRPRVHRPEHSPAAFVPDLKEFEYLEAVRRIKEYIFAGDVYQVNMTQRFRASMGGASPWELYVHLSRINPAPYAAFLNCDRHAVVSSSPELFLRVRDRSVETRPIKGTIKRGATPAEDAANRSQLLQSGKNRAELAMIVDLLRNDLGRVCTPGTVDVRAPVEVESYASVHHLVATVTGELAADRNVVDIIRATFPGGSITGAPKIRAMEIIDELEPVVRGVYTGSIGYLTFDGSAELNIAIRTIVARAGIAYVHAGGGIVADSDEREEYEESLLKAAKLFQAVHAVAGGAQTDARAEEVGRTG